MSKIIDSMAPTPETACPACIVCGGDTVRQISKEYCEREVSYFRCLHCGHLTAGDIGRVPDYDREKYFAEIDTGCRERNRRILEFVRILSRLPGVNLARKDVVLDYGCGTGRLVNDLNATGFNAYGFEPSQGLLQAPGRIMNDWQEVRRVIGRANLVTCIEVLEHVRNPDDLLNRVSELLSSDGYFLISTETYNNRKHGDAWYYLNPAAGHVSIFTEKSLGGLMSRHGLSSILRISGLVWLFRLVAQRKRTWLESGYFFASQSRIKLGIKLGAGLQI